ncbi:MAG: hypothetical protein RMM17_01140 [Acidobacteriota bacterium]|nr:hypothetical protein [Blastocatellia bacterium]MDW8411273.1 hypothetical protein [Acidobacteriota bacterium]
MTAVADACPNPIDHWEVTAVVESLGYTDDRAKELGYDDVAVLGRYIYERLNGAARSETPDETSYRKEVYVFLEKFLSTFVYTASWIIVMFVDAKDVLPAELASPLSLSVMVSLIVSGGFIQIIVKRGSFYVSLGEENLAYSICISFLQMGLIVSIIVAIIGILLNAYLSIFEDKYLIVAASYFVLLSCLWMLCATVSVQRQKWRIPIVFLSGALVYLVLGSVLSELVAQTLAVASVYASALGFAVFGFKKNQPKHEEVLPLLSNLLRLLMPYFLYGVLYFAFLFADRLAAGTALPASSYLAFGIDVGYKRAMDVALLVLLCTASVTEYLSYRFLERLRELAKRYTTSQESDFAIVMKRLHRKLGLITACLFLVLSLGSYYWLLKEGRTWIWVVGSVGYLLLSMSILNCTIMLGLGRVKQACRQLVTALLINVTVSYLLSHIFSVGFASCGVLSGSAMLFVSTYDELNRVLSDVGYACYTS